MTLPTMVPNLRIRKIKRAKKTVKHRNKTRIRRVKAVKMKTRRNMKVPLLWIRKIFKRNLKILKSFCKKRISYYPQGCGWQDVG